MLLSEQICKIDLYKTVTPGCQMQESQDRHIIQLNFGAQRETAIEAILPPFKNAEFICFKTFYTVI